MGWHEEYQQASYKNVPFKVKRIGSGYGRYYKDHAYPQTDDVSADDITRKPRKFSIEGYVIGADYNSQLRPLIRAIEQGGYGELVHPYRGVEYVLATDLEITEVDDEGGIARFNLDFIEAGKKKFPDINTDGKYKLYASADSLITAAKTRFENTVKLAGVTDEVRNGAIGTVSKIFTAVKNISTASSLPQSVIGSSDYAQDFANMQFLFNQIIHPGALIKQTVSDYANLITTVFGIVLDNGSADNGDWTRKVIEPTRNTSYPVIPENTSNNADQNVNAAISTEFVNVVGIATEAKSLSNTVFESRQQAVEVRDDLIDQIDLLLERDQFKTTYSYLRDLKSQIILNGFPDETTLKRIRKVILPATTNSILLAYDVYEDISRADDIVKRNKVRHPGFISGDTELEILVDE